MPSPHNPSPSTLTWYSKARMAWVRGLAANCRQSPPTYWLGYSPAAEPERGAADSSGSARRTCGAGKGRWGQWMMSGGTARCALGKVQLRRRCQVRGGPCANAMPQGRQRGRTGHEAHQLVVLHACARQHHARRGVVGSVEVGQHLCDAIVSRALKSQSHITAATPGWCAGCRSDMATCCCSTWRPPAARRQEPPSQPLSAHSTARRPSPHRPHLR